MHPAAFISTFVIDNAAWTRQSGWPTQHFSCVDCFEVRWWRHSLAQRSAPPGAQEKASKLLLRHRHIQSSTVRAYRQSYRL